MQQLQVLNVLSKNTSTHDQEEPGMKPPILGFVDDCPTNWSQPPHTDGIWPNTKALNKHWGCMTVCKTSLANYPKVGQSGGGQEDRKVNIAFPSNTLLAV